MLGEVQACLPFCDRPRDPSGRISGSAEGPGEPDRDFRGSFLAGRRIRRELLETGIPWTWREEVALVGFPGDPEWTRVCQVFVHCRREFDPLPSRHFEPRDFEREGHGDEQFPLSPLPASWTFFTIGIASDLAAGRRAKQVTSAASHSTPPGIDALLQPPAFRIPLNPGAADRAAAGLDSRPWARGSSRTARSGSALGHGDGRWPGCARHRWREGLAC